jgi:hypothetical protein
VKWDGDGTMGSHPSRWSKMCAPEPIIFQPQENSLIFDYDIEDDLPKGKKGKKL